MQSKQRWWPNFIAVLLAMMALVGHVSSAHALAYNLNADWSDANNPNGVWAYRQGNTTITNRVANSGGVNLPCTQPAWEPTVGGFLPSWFKARCDYGSPAEIAAGLAILTGDVVVHTVDGFNGNPGLGNANVLFTAPSAGIFSIDGKVWSNTSNGRPQEWRLLVNGTVMDFGQIIAPVSRFDPDTFALTNVSLNLGDTVELEMFLISPSCCGNFVMMDMTIASASTPGTFSLLCLSFLGLRYSWQRKRLRRGAMIETGVCA